MGECGVVKLIDFNFVWVSDVVLFKFGLFVVVNFFMEFKKVEIVFINYNNCVVECCLVVVRCFI